MNDFTETLINEADQLKLKGRHDDAIRLCERILMFDLDCIEAYEEIGDNFLSLKEFEKAEKALLRAVQLDPHSANANYLLGFTYSALGDWEGSIEYLEGADQIQANHPEILRCLGWSYFHYGQKKKGIIVLERALNLAWDDCLILCDLGVCYLNEKNFERAIALFQKVLAIEPENEKARECLKACKFFQREYEKMKRKSY
ncbi:tetratricopeptide repeat protein [Candidatus Peregrinibacteria bacterium]|nr:tetratricopeptide repeat protein [Candidatus Peregrinibacteria bacterium]